MVTDERHSEEFSISLSPDGKTVTLFIDVLGDIEMPIETWTYMVKAIRRKQREQKK